MYLNGKRRVFFSQRFRGHLQIIHEDIVAIDYDVSPVLVGWSLAEVADSTLIPKGMYSATFDHVQIISVYNLDQPPISRHSPKPYLAPAPPNEQSSLVDSISGSIGLEVASVSRTTPA